MKITRQQLKRIIKEEKARLLNEQEEVGKRPAPDGGVHHWPRVDWTNVEDLVDKWRAAELEAYDKGDPSMNPEKPKDESQAAWDKEMKARWEDQVENAAMDLEAELTKRVRKLALETMQEFTDSLIAGEWL